MIINLKPLKKRERYANSHGNTLYKSAMWTKTIIFSCLIKHTVYLYDLKTILKRVIPTFLMECWYVNICILQCQRFSFIKAYKLYGKIVFIKHSVIFINLMKDIYYNVQGKCDVIVVYKTSPDFLILESEGFFLLLPLILMLFL